MIKKVIAVVLIILAAGAWLGLDYLNRQAQGEAEQMRQGMQQARAEAKKRTVEEAKKSAEAKLNFETRALASFNHCQAVAEKAKVDYMGLIQKISPIKRGMAVIPKSIADEAARILLAAKSECQQGYDSSLKSGQ